ncbi:tetratricopeptide repeat protein [Actinoplanes sp. NPDC051346]|uniref:tetratricopeptide repeat protein n=1 Tax=Actinoplanes sp. NPDC051346 TaxID=3155048 RepID=UPI00343CC83F
MRQVLKLVGFAVLGVALVVTAGALLAPRDEPTPASRPEARETDPIAAAQRRLQRLPEDWNTWAELGMAFVQRARFTGDTGDHERARRALDRSLGIRPGNAAALTGLGALAAARHDFPAALRHGRAALAVDSYRAAALGVVADALTELGRYEEAFATVQWMVDLRPDAASYARASYTWELRGDVGRATDAMRRALNAATTAEDAAFAEYHLGELAYGMGDLGAAGTHFARGLRLAPGYPPLLIGQARTRAARGETAAAVADFRAVVAAAPSPGYAAELGDLLRSLGRTPDAAQQYALAKAGWAASAESGRPPEPDGVLFAVDQRDPAALSLAQRLYARQPGIGAADALGWALRTAGRPGDALRRADEALRLNTASALLHYHRGMILVDLGRIGAARAELTTALRLNPHFSIRHAPLARAALASLIGAR